MKLLSSIIFVLSLASLSAQIPSYIPQNGLAGWYPFNGNTNDESGNGYDLVNNNALLTADRYNVANSAYYFNGTSAYLMGTGYAFGSDRTISFWYSSNGPSASNQVLVDGTGDLSVYLNNSGYLVLEQFPVWGELLATEVPGIWHHVAVSFSSSSTITVYFDGLYLTSYSHGYTASWNDLIFGRDFSAGSFLNGRLDDIAIWDRTLTNSEVMQLYQRSNCLIAEYPLNGNTFDMSGYGNNSTSGLNSYGSDRFGNPNSAASFNGVDQFIEGSTIGWPISNASRSIELWFKAGTTLVGGGYERLFSYGGTGTGTGQYIQPVAAANGDLTMMSYGGSYNDLDLNYAMNYGQWYHIVTTYDGATASIYVNGTHIGSGNYSWFTDAGTSFVMGAFDDGSGPQGFYSGMLDDIRVYSCVLTNAQIDSLFHMGGITPCNFGVSSVITSPLCEGGMEGGIDQTITGGAAPYNFNWNNGELMEDLINVTPGNYTVVISDANGCDTTINYFITDAVAMDLLVFPTNPNCGANDGSASVAVTNGTFPFEYYWSNGDTTIVADTLSAGTYMVVVNDANGCSVSKTFGLNSANAPTLSANVTNASCSGIFNGAIDITASGGVAPYTYLWAHNGSANEDLINLKPGSYMVQVTDANGCAGFMSVDVGVSSIDLSNILVTQPSCGNSDGEIVVNPNGIGPFTYSWSANAGGATGNTVSNIPADVYFLTVTDANNCSANTVIAVSDLSAPVVSLIAAIPTSCMSSNGSINIGVSGGTPPYSYNWNTGDISQDLTSLTQGDYHVIVTDGDGCNAAFNVELPGITPNPISLCMSTVDSTSGKVLCVWEKGSLSHISHFNVYRENSIAGQYDFWFSQPYDSLSEWVDQTANPIVHGWRYKVTLVDSCGNESPFGQNHKTLHLSANLGISGEVNLIWDNYEGFTYPTVWINRYHPSTGWEVIDSVSSNLHSYVDLNPPGLNGLKYILEIRPPSTCTSTRAVNHNSTRSNRGTVAPPVGISEADAKWTALVFPNPTKGIVNIELEGISANQFNVFVYDIFGKQIMQQKLWSGRSSIDLSAFESGIYIIEIEAGGKKIRQRVIKL
ncbi:MAG: T9SS type A sorting domain-containing protein [Flavobacteriales bacterium]|nr:T9SS type A sorting domain-containing protein [Flavobacteriales bacterium]